MIGLFLILFRIVRTIFDSESTLTPLLKWPLKGYLLLDIYIYIFDDLRQLAKSFCLVWQFCTARSGKTINCNRANRKSKYTKMGIRRSTSINYACKWSIRFLEVVKCKHTTSDTVVILIHICSH